jgi:RNA polymerase sigma-B factor
MEHVTTRTFPSEPVAAPQVRAFVRSLVELGPLRQAEVDLMVTELVGNVLRHSPDVPSFTVEVSTEHPLGIEVAVSHPFDRPFDPPRAGLGFTLLEKLSRGWGHTVEDGTLRVWFVVGRPGAVPRLDQLDELELYRRLDEDPPTFTEELLRRHRDLAETIARRYRGKGIDDSDLEQIALMALLRAIQRFDPSKGDLRRFAASTISGEMKKALRDEGWALRVPRSLKERALEVGQVAESLSHDLNRRPRIEEIADAMGMSPVEVAEALQARRSYRSETLDGPEEGRPLKEALRSDRPTPDDADDRILLEEAIADLPERLRRVLDLRFNHDMTQSEIAETIGVSQMHVSRMLRDALDRLRELLTTTDRV